MVDIYILKLTNDKYYVGRTNNIDRRIEDHISSNGSEWTKRHLPVVSVDVIKGCDSFDEDKYVIKTMAKHGIDNVRGGSFSRIVLDDKDREIIQRCIRGAQDTCFKCGSSGHWAKNCKGSKTPISASTCTRCGRNNHDLSGCFATYHLDGKRIDKVEGVGENRPSTVTKYMDELVTPIYAPLTCYRCKGNCPDPSRCTRTIITTTPSSPHPQTSEYEVCPCSIL
jgi:hypothetical protein